MTSPIDVAYVAIEPEFSGFTRQVSTELLAPLESIDRAVRELVSTLESQFAELGRVIVEDVKHATNEADNAFDSMKRNAVADMDAIERKAETSSSSMGSKFGKVASVLTLGFGAVAAGAGFLAKTGLQSAGSLEQVNVAFDSLTGSVAKGNAQFKQLQQFAAATPFQFTDLTTGAQRFDAFAKSIGQTQDQLIPFLTTIGNLVSETGGGAQALDTISLAFGQTASQGKLTLGNLDQINNAIPGFNAVAAIAAVRGESTAKVMDEISKGTIDAKTGLNQLLIGMQKFPGAAGAMQKQSETLLGVFSTFQDTVSQSLSNAFAPAIPLIKNSLTQITPIIGKALDTVGPALGGLVANLLPLLGNLVAGLVPIITPILQALSEAAKILSPALKPLGDAIGLIFKALEPLVPVLAKIVVALADALAPVIAALAPVITDLVGPLGDMLIALVPLIPPLGELLVAVIQLAEPLIKLVALFLKWNTKLISAEIKIAVPLIQALADGIAWLAKWIDKINWKSVWEGIVSVAKAVGGFFVGLWNDVTGFFASIPKWLGKVGDFFASLWSSVVSFFEGLPGRIGNFLSSLPGILVDAATTAFHLFFQAIGFGIGLIIKEFMALPGQIGAVMSWVWSKVTTAWNNIVAFFEGLPARIGKAAAELWNWVTKEFNIGVHNIEHWASSLYSSVTGWFAKMWDRGKANFSKGVDDVVSFAKALPGRVVSWISTLPGKIASAVSGAGHWLYDTGKNLIMGLIHGVEDIVGHAIDVVKGAMTDIIKGAKSALGIGSPSKVFAEIGHNVVLGYTQGVEAKAPGAELATMQAIGVPAGLQAGQTGSQGGVMFGPGSVVLNFNGAVPTPQEALVIGRATGHGISDVLVRRNVRNQVRTL